MKSIFSILVVAFFLSTTSKAQNDPNSGFIIDGVLTDTIPSWGFSEMSVVIPITSEMKKFDVIQGALKSSKFEGTPGANKSMYFQLDVTKDLADLADSKYLVVNIFKKGSDVTVHNGAFKRPIEKNGYATFDWEPSNDKDGKPMLKNCTLTLSLKGHKITGYNEEPVGDGSYTKKPVYDNKTTVDGLRMCNCGIVLFESRVNFQPCYCKYPNSKAWNKAYDANTLIKCEECKENLTKVPVIPGKKFPFAIEKVDYEGKFGKVK